MIVTCPACARRVTVADDAHEAACACGRRFDPTQKPTIADPFLGREFHGLRVEEVLGSGGMGTVYRATQLSLGRPVALKVLPADVAQDPQFVARFHREAEVLASLAHGNVVQVYDRGEVDGRFYFVMEYVDGVSLRTLIRRGRVPPKEALRILSALLDALDYAHRRGVVHRDVKPENVLVTREGVVKVADFGLSRVLGPAELDARLTRTHLVLGTYEYMAPELREGGRNAGPRSDVYAAAVLLYEMLTGELPIGRFDPPSRRAPGVDRRIDAVLDRGLAKDPDARFAAASEMGRAVASLLSMPGAPVDLGALRGAATRARSRIESLFRRSPDGPRPPTAFDARYDLLLTVLAVLGIGMSVVGAVLVVSGEDFEVGIYELDRDASGWIVTVFGLLLWNAAERARRFWPGARTTLLVLTALAAPTVVGLPAAIWTWAVLLHPAMRVYLDARHRGVDPEAAAALAQGLALPAREPPEFAERRRLCARDDRHVARVLAAFGGAALVGWIVVAFDSPSRAVHGDEVGLLVTAGACAAASAALFHLAGRVARGKSARLHARVWSVLGWLYWRPGARRRARMLARDARTFGSRTE